MNASLSCAFRAKTALDNTEHSVSGRRAWRFFSCSQYALSPDEWVNNYDTNSTELLQEAWNAVKIHIPLSFRRYSGAPRDLQQWEHPASWQQQIQMWTKPLGRQGKNKASCSSRHKHAVKYQEDKGRHVPCIFTKVRGAGLGGLTTNISILRRTMVWSTHLLWD